MLVFPVLSVVLASLHNTYKIILIKVQIKRASFFYNTFSKSMNRSRRQPITGCWVNKAKVAPFTAVPYLSMATWRIPYIFGSNHNLGLQKSGVKRRSPKRLYRHPSHREFQPLNTLHTFDGYLLGSGIEDTC